MLQNTALRWLDKIYCFVVVIGSNLQSLFLLYMRLTWGHQFFMTGIAKLRDIDPVIQLLSSLDISHPAFHAYEIAIIESVGGILLFIGLASRIVAIPLIFVMLTALATAHAQYLSNFQFVTNPLILVIQQPYPFLLTAILVFIFGPGRISFDAWIKRWIDQQPRY